MNSFQLDCFLCVSSHLNFARAAEEMNLTQPAISHQIKSLEEELGVKLFHRTTRSVSLTHEGEIFLQEASKLVIQLKSLRSKFRAPQKREILPFEIGCSSEALMWLLPDVLYRLASEVPNLHPILRNLPAPQIEKRMGEGQADAALGLKEPMTKEADLSYTELVRTPLVCICDATHPLGELEQVGLTALKEHCLVFYRPTFCSSQIARLQIELSEGKRADEIFFCDDITSAVTLVGAGFGVSVIPKIFLPYGHSPLRILPLSDREPLSFGVYLKKDASPLHKRFAALLKQTLISLP